MSDDLDPSWAPSIVDEEILAAMQIVRDLGHAPLPADPLPVAAATGRRYWHSPDFGWLPTDWRDDEQMPTYTTKPA